MIYVMSDIHGEYQKYLKMLDLIQFSEEDSLFILGDIVDRGKDPVPVLKDMMTRSNIFPIMGNHDFVALYLLSLLSTNITGETVDSTLQEDDIQDILAWIDDGGDTTIAQFQKIQPLLIDKTHMSNCLNRCFFCTQLLNPRKCPDMALAVRTHGAVLRILIKDRL